MKGLFDMMKVVQINAVYEYSSTGRITMELDLALKKEGWGSYVFCTNKDDPKNGIYCMGTPFSRKAHGFLSRLTGLQGYYSRSATGKMLRQLDKIKPDVVHLGNLHGNYIHVNMLLDYLKKNQIPTVVTLHDCWLFTGHCCHYLEDNCDRWQYGCGKCPAKHKWNKSWFFDRSAKVYADRKAGFGKLKSLTVVGVSDWVTNECRKSFMKENAHFARIYNWIDLETFSPRERLHHERPRVLSVAQSWSKTKGIYDIIQIASEHPGYDFLLIGELSENIKIPPNMKLLGVINDVNKLAEQYGQADALLHLSYQETFGKVVAEALACGTPAIVYNITALPELIGSGCGAVVEKGDWKAAGEALDELLSGMINTEDTFDKPPLTEKKTDAITDTASNASEIANTCRKYAISHFDKTTLIKQWIELYKAVSNLECTQN